MARVRVVVSAIGNAALVVSSSVGRNFVNRVSPSEQPNLIVSCCMICTLTAIITIYCASLPITVV